jgi:hypothetical protein
MQRASKGIEQSVRNKEVTMSGFSKGEQKDFDEYKKLGITVDSTNPDGALRVDIPNNRINEFVELWGQLSEPGYWCEYVGPQTGFVFKSPAGEFRHIILSPETEQLISEEMQKFTGKYNPDMWQWIYQCDIFTDRI